MKTIFLLIVIYPGAMSDMALVQTFPTMESCQAAAKIVFKALPGLPKTSCTEIKAARNYTN